MKMIIAVFGRIWALWGLFTFLITFFIIFPFSLITYLFYNKKKGQQYFNTLSRSWMRVWLFSIGCKIKINGLHYFNPDNCYIVVFNHNSMLDIPLSSPFVPGANKTIGKSSFSKIPLFGQFYRMGTVLVNRKNPASRKKSYEQMKDVLQQDMHMCIYPEGTRNRTDLPLKSFFDGAFKLSIDTQTNIIPCVLTGTKKALPPNRFLFLFPTTLSMEFLKPIAPQRLSIQELNQKVFDTMLEVIHSKTEVL
jgi:1-acyl-sn-glycerol-3-phosphate acyltransferase